MNEIIRNCVVRFEGQQSWIGPYSEAFQKHEANQNQFKHLSTDCGICLENFLPNEQIIVLPCTHGLHDKCFKPWSQQACPYDNTPSSGIKKIEFLGYSVIFQRKNLKIGLWLASQEKKINQMLQKSLLDAMEKHPEELQKLLSIDQEKQKTLKFFATILVNTLQDSLDVFEGIVSPDQIHAKIEANLVLLKEALSQSEIDEFVKNANLDWDFYSFASRIPKMQESIPQLLFLCRQFTNFTIDFQEWGSFLTYFCELFKRATQDPIYQKITEETDRRFFTHHFKIIRTLTDQEKLSYLRKMSPSSLERINRLNQGRNTRTCLKIRDGIANITLRRKQIKALKDLSLTCAVAAVGFAVFFLSDFPKYVRNSS